jgi:hypothetical protein
MVMASNAAECTRLYREALAQADAIGMKELDEFQNQKFQENKKRLGAKILWPRYL